MIESAVLGGYKWILLITFVTGLLTGIVITYPTHLQRLPSLTNQSTFKLLPQYVDRNQLVTILISEKSTAGAEVGVQLGVYAEYLLSRWEKCTKYHAIDLWAHQKHYHDSANLDDAKQEDNYRQTRQRLKRFEHIVHYHRNYSNLAVKEIEDNSLDFIYIDARHDYAGVAEDLTLYWPKLKVNGIFAGHDYLDTDEVKTRTPDQDWSIGYRGTKRTDNKAVKSAVNEFAQKHQRQILVTLPEVWPTWYMRK